MCSQLVNSVHSLGSCLKTQPRYCAASCKCAQSVLICSNDKSILEYNTQTNQYNKRQSVSTDQWTHSFWGHSMTLLGTKLFIITGSDLYILHKGQFDWSHLYLPCSVGSDHCIATCSDDDNHAVMHILGENMHLQINPISHNIIILSTNDTPCVIGSNMVQYNGFLYVFGGQKRIGNKVEYFDAVHRYDILKKIWYKNMDTLPGKRAYASCVRYYKYAIIIGGRYNNSYHNDILVYDMERHQTLRQIELLPYRMSNATATVIGNEIHQFGGFVNKVDIDKHGRKAFNDHIVVILKDLDEILISGFAKLYFGKSIALDLILYIIKPYVL